MINGTPISLLDLIGVLNPKDRFEIARYLGDDPSTGEPIFESRGIEASLLGTSGGGGDLTGTLTPNYIPVATAPKVLGDSSIFYDGSGLHVKSLAGTSTIDLLNNNITASVNAGGIINLNGSVGTVKLSSTLVTNSRILAIDGAGNLVTGAANLTDLTNISGTSSNLQVQIDGKIDGTLTPTRVPYAIGSFTLSDSRISQLPTHLRFDSPNALTRINIFDNNISLRSPSTGGVGLSTIDIISNGIIIQWTDSSILGEILLDASGIRFLHTTQATFNVPSTYFPSITADRVAVLDGSSKLTAGNVTIPEVNTLTGINTGTTVQTQLNTKITGSLTAGYMPYATSSNTIANSGLFYNLGSNRWGIGTTTPNSTFHLVGGFQYVDGNQAVGKILTSDANGVAIWATASGGGMTNPMTNIGDMIQATTAGAPVRLAAVPIGNVLLSNGINTPLSWGKVVINTHTSAPFIQGSIIYQGTTNTVLAEDNANFFYDSTLKQLRVRSILTNTNVGMIGHSINTNGALGINITSNAGGINIINSGTALPGLNIYSSGYGIVSHSPTGVAGDFTGLYPGAFTQGGNLTANSTAEVVNIFRTTTLNAFTSTGALLNIYDSSGSTGNRIIAATNLATQFVINSSGFMGLAGVSNPTQAIVIDGAVDRTIQVARNPLSATAGSAMFVLAGGAAVGSTNLNGGALILCSGVVTGTGSSEIQFRTAKGAATGTADTLTNTKMTLLGKGYLGLGTTNPSSWFEMLVENGDTGFNILNKNLSTSSTIGWGCRPATNTTGTNLLWYELDPAITNRLTFHKGGNITVGAVPSGNGDAKFHVIGTVKIQDGSEGAGKVWTSDGVGLGSWQTPSGGGGFTSPMTTIADIIQASATVAGGSPVRLGGSPTAGTFLRSGGTGVLNDWSILVLPNATTTGYIPYSTASNVIGVSAELQYISSAGQGAITKSQNASTSWGVVNGNGGVSTLASLYVSCGSGDFYLTMTGSGNTDPNKARLQTTASEMQLLTSTTAPIRFMPNGAETARISTTGMSIGTGANPISIALLDLASTTQGVRFPRMTTAQRTGITTTSLPGLVVFDTDTNQLMVTNNSGTWVAL